MSSPVTLRRFFWSDLALPGLFLIGLGLAIGAHLTPQDSPVPLVGWLILWAVVLAFLIINLLFVYHRLTMGKELRYMTRGMIVAWKEDKYEVKDTVFEEAIDTYITMMKPKYPEVERALAGCVVLFREPKWPLHVKKGKVLKYAAGLQDNNVLYVGWHANLADSALDHEMTHLVFQVFENDPPEELAHTMMKSLGIS